MVENITRNGSRVRLIVDVIKSYFGWVYIDSQAPVVLLLLLLYF